MIKIAIVTLCLIVPVTVILWIENIQLRKKQRVIQRALEKALEIIDLAKTKQWLNAYQQHLREVKDCDTLSFDEFKKKHNEKGNGWNH